jgi:hypothetical protein
MVYEAVLLRNGEEIQTLYWSGSLQETVTLARTIALKWEVDRFRITEFTDSEMELGSEEAPSPPAVIFDLRAADRRLS